MGQISPRQYTESRSFLTGAVTGLSAYIRHGVVSLAEMDGHWEAAKRAGL